MPLAEHDENGVRKDFTVSECVAITKAIEAQLGKRQGQRTDKEFPQNFAKVKRGKQINKWVVLYK